MTKQTAIYAIGERFKKWHPSIGFHMLRGEVLTYYYLAAIMDAMYMLKTDLKTTTSEQLSQGDQQVDTNFSLSVVILVKKIQCHDIILSKNMTR